MNQEQFNKQQLDKDREQLVVKSNELITKTRYDLSVIEQKVIVYLISRICAEDKDFKTIEMSISDYCNLLGISHNSNNYKIVKKSIQNISNKSWWISYDKGERLFRWIDTCDIEKKAGKVIIRLSDSLKPYLLDIKSNFSKYELINVLLLHSKYSIRLYEIFKSFLWVGNWTISVNDFKDMLLLGDKYKTYQDLKKRVIEPAIKEINDYTDLIISLETIKSGKSVEGLKFKIEEKRGYQICLETLVKQRERLNDE